MVAQYFGEVPRGTQYVVGMSFVGPSGLAQVKQDLMHCIALLTSDASVVCRKRTVCRVFTMWPTLMLWGLSHKTFSTSRIGQPHGNLFSIPMD